MRSIPGRSNPAAHRVGPYLNEVQGLRTIAAMMVAVYHIWLQRVSGGVDIFFVVAAFFMVKSLGKTSTLGLKQVLDYYLSTIRRVLPSSTIVIVATIALCLMLLPQAAWKLELGHAAASIFFIENRHLASVSTNYLDQGVASSPFQQMWALSLQMQLYILTPMLIFTAGVAARLARVPVRTMTLVALFTVFIASLAFSIYFTNANQARAYFDIRARAWEFAAGGILALSYQRVTLSPRMARTIGVISLLIIVSFARIIDVSAEFPGYMALVPVLCAIGVILASQNGGNVPVLTWKPVVAAGNYSFAFYLWHWPLLSFARILLVRDDVGLPVGLAILVGSAVLAYATTRFCETPFRENSMLSGNRWLAAAACGIILTPAAAALGAWKMEHSRALDAASRDVTAIRANPEYRSRTNAFIPASVEAKYDDSDSAKKDCFQTVRNPAVVSCIRGDRNGIKTVLIVGGSHAAQWFPPVEKLALKHKLRIVLMNKAGCFLSTDNFARAKRYASCMDWNRQVLPKIVGLHPDLVITMGSRRVSGKEIVPPGYIAVWSQIVKAGIPILAIRDNPNFGTDAPYCLDLKGAARCGISRTAFYADRSPTRAITMPLVSFVDFSDDFCPDNFCPIVADGLIRYRDAHHLTATYALTFAERLEQVIFPAMLRQ